MLYITSSVSVMHIIKIIEILCIASSLSIMDTSYLSTLRPRQNDRHSDIFTSIFLNGDMIFFINITPKFVPKGEINNISFLFQMMAWRWPGKKPLSEPMMISLQMHICAIQPQCGNFFMKVLVTWISFTNLYNICNSGCYFSLRKKNGTSFVPLSKEERYAEF